MKNISQEKKRLGIVKERGDFFITGSGGRIARGVLLYNIATNAYIGPGSVISGKNTCIGPGAVIKGSLIDDAVIGPHARIIDSVIHTVEEKACWTFRKGSVYQVKGCRSFISQGSSISGGSHLINSFVDKDTRINASFISDSRIGSRNRIKKARIHLTATLEEVTVSGPTEVAESYLGAYLTIDKPGYIEAVFTNEIITAETTKSGRLKFGVIKSVPSICAIGSRVICSGYSGTMKNPENGILDKITGKESSSHGTPVIAPFSVLSNELRLIALSAHPDIEDEKAFMKEKNITYLMPFSVTGFEADEHWGWALPGERSLGLSRSAGSAPWLFERSPDTIIRFIKEASKLAPSSQAALIDELPRRMLLTGKALAGYLLREQINRKITGTKDRVKNSIRIRRLKEDIKLYDKHILSGAWHFKDGRPENFVFDKKSGKWHSSKISLPDQYLFSALTGNSTALDKYEKKGLIKRSALFVPFPESKGGKESANASELRKRWKVNADKVSRLPESVLAVNAYLRGSKTEEAVCLQGARLENSTVRTGSSVTGAVIKKSDIGKNCEIECGASITNSSIGSGSIVGSACKNSRIGAGFTDHHIVSYVDSLKTPDIKFRLMGEEETAANTTNIGAGTAVIPAAKKNKIYAVCESAFLCSNSVIEAGAHIGFGSFIKGKVFKDETLFPFTFRNGLLNAKSSGAQYDSIGGVLSYPEVIMRHLISKSKKTDPDAKTDFLIEAKLLEAAGFCIKAVFSFDSKGFDKIYKPVYGIDALDEGLRRFLSSLDGRWRLRDGIFTDGAWHYNNKNGKFCWQPNEFIGDINSKTMHSYMSKNLLPRSFSGARAAFGLGPVSPELRLIAALFSFYFAKDLQRKESFKSSRTKKLVIAHDSRLSGYDLAKASLYGMLAAFGEREDVSIINAGILTTPLFEQAVRTFKADGGVMITGSHNTMDQNGFKFATGYKIMNKGEVAARGALISAEAMSALIKKVEDVLQGPSKKMVSFSEKINGAAKKKREEIVTAQGLIKLKTDYEKFILNSLRLDIRQAGDAAKMLNKKGVQVVFDTAGGSATPFYPSILRSIFPLDIEELADTLGQSRKKIEPTGEGLHMLEQALKRKKTAVGLASDFDADRGNLIIKEPGKKPYMLESQTLSAFNLAMFLSWLDIKNELSHKKVAVVTNDATSLRIDEIADYFNAQVVSVEVGEINLVEKAQQLKNRGCFVPFLTEGSNGGAIFGESCVRDGIMSLVFCLLVMARPEIYLRWLERKGALLSSKEKARIKSGRYTISEIVKTLPASFTVSERITEKGKAVNQAKLKQKMEKLLASHYDAKTDRLKDSFYGLLEKNNCKFAHLKTYRIIYHQALCREAAQLTKTPAEAAGKGIGDPLGGWKAVFFDKYNCPCAFIWLRGSRTEPGGVFNIMADSRNKKLSTALINLLKDLYKQGKK